MPLLTLNTSIADYGVEQAKVRLHGYSKSFREPPYVP
jgi:hypothetical protein